MPQSKVHSINRSIDRLVVLVLESSDPVFAVFGGSATFPGVIATFLGKPAFPISCFVVITLQESDLSLGISAPTVLGQIMIRRAP